MRTQEVRQELDGRIAALEHMEKFLERHTTLPLGDVRMEATVARIEKQHFEGLAEVEQRLTGLIRSGELLGKETGELRFLQHRVREIQAEEIEARGEE